MCSCLSWNLARGHQSPVINKIMLGMEQLKDEHCKPRGIFHPSNLEITLPSSGTNQATAWL